MIGSVLKYFWKKAPGTPGATPPSPAPAPTNPDSARPTVRLHGTWQRGRQTEKAFHATCLETGTQRWLPKSHAHFEDNGCIRVSPWLAAKVYEEFYLHLSARAHEEFFLHVVQQARGEDEDEDDFPSPHENPH